MEDLMVYAALAGIVGFVGLLFWFGWHDAQRQSRAQGVVPPTTCERVDAAKAAVKGAGEVAKGVGEGLVGCGGCLFAALLLFLLVLAVMAVLKWMWHLV